VAVENVGTWSAGGVDAGGQQPDTENDAEQAPDPVGYPVHLMPLSWRLERYEPAVGGEDVEVASSDPDRTVWRASKLGSPRAL